MLTRYIVLLLFSLFILFLGYLGMKKVHSSNDFLLGGGKIGSIMSAFTYGTAYFSAVIFIGFAGKIGWGFGYSALWIAFGNAFIGTLGVWWLIGKKVKKAATEFGVSTMSGYLEKRYNSKFLMIFASICICIFFIPYSAAVFMGLSYLFQSNFQISYVVALSFMGILTAAYVFLGGYRSMSMVDVLFGVIMTVGVFILIYFVLKQGGGIQNITSQLQAIHPKLTSLIGPPGIWPLFSLVFLTSVAPFGMPQLVTKFYAIKNEKAIKTGMIASTIFAILISGTAYFIGSTLRVFINASNNPSVFKNNIPIYDSLMPELLAKVIPGSLSIIVLLLILSASMSTLAALILICSSTFAKDIWANFRETNDTQITLLMRLSAIFFVFLSVVFALLQPASIVSILGISWGAIGSVFLGPFIWGLFYKKANKLGAICSSLGGLSLCLGLYFSGFSSPEAGTLGMIASLTIIPIISFFSQNKK